MVLKSNRFLYFALLGVFVCASLKCQAQEPVSEVLPEQINSSFIEIRPFISHDGQTLYFSRREHPENFDGEKDMQDVWIAQRHGDSWTIPVNMGKEINNKHANSLCSVSPDGQELLMFNTYKKINGPLARFKKQGDSWGKPEAVAIRNYQNYNEYLDFYQSYTANVLLLAIETDESLGEQDLYVSFPDAQGIWSEPLNLGAGINTGKSEFAPFLAADGKTLFFSSYGRKGQGGADIYYTTRLDDSWQKWSTPVNLGGPINSKGEETYCSVTEDLSTIYYVSYRHGSDLRDIMMSALPASLRTSSQSLLAEATALPESAQQSAVEVPKEEKGASSQSPKQPMEQEMEVPAVQEPIQGSASASKTATVKSQEQPNGENALNLAHKAWPTEIADMQQYIILRNIYFEFNQLSLKQDNYEKMLQELVSFVGQQPGARIRLVGHSDELGTAAGNRKTSQQRAQSVKDYLVSLGVPKEQVLVEFKGEAEPLASNDDDREGRELNRRVEIFVLTPLRSQ